MLQTTKQTEFVRKQFFHNPLKRQMVLMNPERI